MLTLEGSERMALNLSCGFNFFKVILISKMGYVGKHTNGLNSVKYLNGNSITFVKDKLLKFYIPHKCTHVLKIYMHITLIPLNAKD